MQNTNSLKSKTLTGLFWSFTELAANHGIQFVIQIILARLLLPEHFGIMAIFLVFIAISTTIIDSGFSQALIREQNTSQEDYSTVFYFNLIIGLVLYAVLYLSAGLIGSFFEEKQLPLLIRVLGAVLIINSFGLIHKVMLIKNINFKVLTVVNVISAITSGSITIIFAMHGYGVWSLVINIISMQFMQTLLFWFMNKWKPLLVFSKVSFNKYFKFSYKLLLSNLIDTFYNNLYFIIIGRLYTTSQLGYYTNAVKFRDMAAQAVSATVQRVSYPVLSSIQNDEKRLTMGFRKIIKTSSFINFPLMIGLAAIATPLFHILLGEKWQSSIIYFQLLCIAGMIYPLHAINLNILQVKGRSDLFLIIEILKKGLLTILILLALFFKTGVMGLILAAVLSSYVSLFINTYYSAREINYPTKDQIKDILPSFLVSLVMGTTVFMIGYVLPDSNLIKLIIQICAGIFIYISLSKLTKIQELSTVFHILIALLLNFKSTLSKNDPHKDLMKIEKKIGGTE